jgi:uncharacterized protein with von Willebrand factor type A (vWA) domain
MRRLGDKRKNFLDKEVAYSPYSVQTDKLDIRLFREVLEGNPQLKETLEEAQEGYPQFAELQQDIFSALYRYKPRLLKEHKVKASHLMNRFVMGDIMESPKYKELRALTRLDTVNSTVGTEVLGDEAHKTIKKLKEQMKKLQELIQAEQDAAAAQQNQQGQQGQGQGATAQQGQGEKAGKDSEKLTLEEAQKKLEKAKKEFRKSMKKKEVKQQIMRMLEKTQQVITETSEMIQNWGLDGDNTFTNMPYHEKMELLKQLRENRKLKKIAELAGRFKHIATQRQREKVKKGMDEIYDLSLGRELNRLIPSELMKLRHSVSKKQFYKDFSEGKLLQYELRGKEKKQRGAIVIALDGSGSMMGDPEVWAKAVAVALLEVAIYQKRSFYCIHFDHTHNPRHLHTNEFPKEAPKNIQEIIDMATYFTGGGTLFEPALTKARLLIDREEDYHKADIIFVTDGESAVTQGWLDDFLKWRDDNRVTIYGILIDSYYNSDSSLKLFCNEIHKLSTINQYSSEELAITLFDAM